MLIYKITDDVSWRAALAQGTFDGSADDRRDGFIHFSTAEQTPATLAKHFAGRAGLVVGAVDPARLADAIRWEASRGGALFPHLYGPLPVAAVVWWRPLPLGRNGVHVLPDEVV